MLRRVSGGYFVRAKTLDFCDLIRDVSGSVMGDLGFLRASVIVCGTPIGCATGAPSLKLRLVG